MAEPPQLRVSDAERERAVELLHGHRMAGRLDVDEHEERVTEAYRAVYASDLDHAMRELPPPAPPPAPPGPPVFVQPREDSGGASLGFSITALAVLLFSAGFGAILALPLAGTGWALATRSERRRGLRLAQTATALSALSLVLWTLWFVVGLATFVG